MERSSLSPRHRLILSGGVRWLRGSILTLIQKLVSLVHRAFQHKLWRLVMYFIGTILVLRYIMRGIMHGITKKWQENIYLIPEKRLSGIPRRYAVCFYGTHMSLKHVLPSIACNVFKPVTAAGDTYDVFVHTFEDDIPGEERQRQLKTCSAEEAIMDLSPVSSLTTSLKDFEAILHDSPDLNITLQHYADFDKGMEVLRDQHSLSRVWEIMVQYSSSQGIDYSGVISLRLDNFFLNALDIQGKNIPPNRIYFPGNDIDATNSDYNSLFAYGNFDAMRTYMSRRDKREIMKRYHGMDHTTAEESLMHTLKMANIDMKYSQVHMVQVLPSGIVSIKDVKLCENFLEKKCTEESSSKISDSCHRIREILSANVSETLEIICPSSTT